MPQFDLRYIQAAKYTNTSGTVTYAEKTKVGDAMSANLDLKFAEGRLYAEGRLSEYMRLATGGTITEPMLAVVGDAPETIVPHGDTPRNRALLGEAAAGVGASVGGTVVNFNVTISGGNTEEVRQGILEAEDEFERRMDAYFARKARVSFAL